MLRVSRIRRFFVHDRPGPTSKWWHHSKWLRYAPASGALTCSLGICQPQNNEPLRSGTLRRPPKLRGERERLRIFREGRVPLWEKKEPRPHERKQNAQDKRRFRSSSLFDAMFFATISDLFPAAFSSTFARARFTSLFPATSAARLPAPLV